MKTIRKLLKMWLNKIQRTVEQSEDNTPTEGMAVVADEMMLFINSLPAEQPSEDLEDEIDRYYKADTTGIMMTRKQFGEVINHFTNWQKAQMMKGFCFETKVYQDCDGDDVESPFQTWLSLEQNEITALPNLGLSDGDKVKVIIVKEDEQ